MRALLSLAAIIALAGCAGTKVSLYEGEKDDAGIANPTGAVVVLDEASGADAGLIDRANSRSAVRKRRLSVRDTSEAKLNKRYGALLSSLPEKPKLITLYFETNSTELVQGSDALIQEMFAEIAKRPGVDVQITGHTDAPGELDFNDNLSLKRASLVRDLLVGKGMDAELARPTGRGERQPVEDVGEAPSNLNRRVEIFIK